MVGLPNNSYKPITNTAWVRARFCKLQKGCTRLTATSDKVHQLLTHGRWWSPVSSTTKTGRHDIAEILLKVALNTKNQIIKSTVDQLENSDKMFIIHDFFNSSYTLTQGRIQRGAHPTRAPPPPPPPPPKIGKNIIFCVKSWFFTRNTPKMFAPPSARRNFFKCAPPSLKSWIRPCNLFILSKLTRPLCPISVSFLTEVLLVLVCAILFWVYIYFGEENIRCCKLYPIFLVYPPVLSRTGLKPIWQISPNWAPRWSYLWSVVQVHTAGFTENSWTRTS